jgi:hypothetical protein
MLRLTQYSKPTIATGRYFKIYMIVVKFFNINRESLTIDYCWYISRGKYVWLQIKHYVDRVVLQSLEFRYNGEYSSHIATDACDTGYLIGMIAGGEDSNLQRFIYAAQHGLITKELAETVRALKMID